MQCNAKWFELSEPAAKVGIAFPKAGAIEFLLLFSAEAGGNRADLDAVTVLEAPPQVIGFREQEAGIQEEDISPGVDCYCDIDKSDSLGSEPGGDGEPVSKLIEGPFEGFTGAGVFQHLSRAANKSMILAGPFQRLNLNQVVMFKLDLRRHIHPL